MTIFKKKADPEGSLDHSFDLPSAPVPASGGAHLARAMKCPECSLRDAVISNLKAGSYTRDEDIESDLKALEAMPKS